MTTNNKKFESSKKRFKIICKVHNKIEAIQKKKSQIYSL